LRSIRAISVLVVHPKDRDAEDLLAQLRRIGCQASAVWPIPADVPVGVRAVFLSIRPETLDSPQVRRLAQAGHAAMIGVTEYENPATVEALLTVGAVAVVPKPIRAIGLLTTLALALSVYDKADASAKRIAKLESRLTALKEIEQAKSILMARSRLNEARACDGAACDGRGDRTSGLGCPRHSGHRPASRQLDDIVVTKGDVRFIRSSAPVLPQSEQGIASPHQP